MKIKKRLSAYPSSNFVPRNATLFLGQSKFIFEIYFFLVGIRWSRPSGQIRKKSSFLFVMCLMDLIRKVAKSGGSQAHIRNILIRYRWLMRRKIRNLALFHIQISLENFWASNTLIPLKAIINGHFSTETGEFEIFTIFGILFLLRLGLVLGRGRHRAGQPSPAIFETRCP